MRRTLATVSVVVLAVAFGGVLVTSPAAVSAPAVGAEWGAYEWDTASWWPNPSAYSDTLTRLRSLGVTTLYVDITEAVTLARDHSSALVTFEDDFGQLIADADDDGLRVDAVGGDPRWATTDRTGPAQLLAVVSRIVAGFPDAPLDGVQFDVEPWALTSWSSHRAVDARDWLGFVQSTVDAWRSDGLPGRLGFTVPYWFDGDTGGVPASPSTPRPATRSSWPWPSCRPSTTRC